MSPEPRVVNIGYYAGLVSTTRLMILGLVKWLQPVHGYDVRRELLSWNVESWANIQPGSIYHALRKLTEEGMLAEVATEQVGARPARTTYRCTDKGEAEFRELLGKYAWEYREPVDPFLSAFAFLPTMSRDQAARVLRARARTIEAMAANWRENLGPWSAEKPEHVSWQFELTIGRLDVEARWCHDIAGRIEAGQGDFQEESPEHFSAEAWRAGIRAEFGEPTESDLEDD